MGRETAHYVLLGNFIKLNCVTHDSIIKLACPFQFTQKTNQHIKLILGYSKKLNEPNKRRKRMDILCNQRVWKRRFWEHDRKKIFQMPPCCTNMLTRTSMAYRKVSWNNGLQLSGDVYLKCLFQQFNSTPTENYLPWPILREAISAFVSA